MKRKKILEKETFNTKIVMGKHQGKVFAHIFNVPDAKQAMQKSRYAITEVNKLLDRASKSSSTGINQVDSSIIPLDAMFIEFEAKNAIHQLLFRHKFRLSLLEGTSLCITAEYNDPSMKLTVMTQDEITAEADEEWVDKDVDFDISKVQENTESVSELLIAFGQELLRTELSQFKGGALLEKASIYI